MPNRKRQTKADPAGFAELRDRLVERYPGLSHQQRRIATFVLARPETIAVETAEQLARRLDVQPSALVRFAHAVDYASFREMKQHFKAHLLFKGTSPNAAAGTDLAADPEDAAPAAFLDAALAQARDELDHLARSLEHAPFEAAVRLLDEAPHIHLTAQHQAYPFAALFAWLLIRRGRFCHLLDNTGGYALPQANLAAPDDLLVAISLAPYQPSVVQAANAHKARGGKVLAISDTALGPLSSAATTLLELPHANSEPVRPLAALTTLVQALVLATTRRR